MLTKFTLHINDTDYELRNEDLRNWDEIRCSYKRADYDGVVRSFSTQFVFTDRAREIIRAAYLRDRFNVKASISVSTSDNRWNYVERFSCPLDFSTISWDAYSLTINCVDNSLAALIKANKSTKYEFAIGEDVAPDNTLAFDRLPMKETVTFGFTQGLIISDELPDLWVTFEKDTLPWVGNTGSEISVNGSVYWNDDQEHEETSYLLKAEKDVDIEMEYELSWRTDTPDNRSVSLYLDIYRNDALYGNRNQFITVASNKVIGLGEHPSPADLREISLIPADDRPYVYATVQGIVWRLKYNGHEYTSWYSTGKNEAEYFSTIRTGKVSLSLKKGDTVKLSSFFVPTVNSVSIRFTGSKFTFSWSGRGDAVSIDVFTPRHVAEELLHKIADEKLNVDVEFSEHDPRIASTFIMAAESARGIAVAKLYSSFNEFCDWMSTVFGYVYYLGERKGSSYKYIRECGQYEYTPWSYVDEMYHGSINTDNIVYFPQHARFMYHNPSDGKLYTQWNDCELYNDSTGHPRTDTLFRINELGSGLWYFNTYSGGTLNPLLYGHPEESAYNDTQTVHFLHRSEVFHSDGEARAIPSCRDVSFSVDNAKIYSAVTIGYEKKDYDNINGRDEFNFNNTYTTGCTVTDKTLSLLSKYRADSYGIEFAVQKRGEDTTDSSSDNDVFFLLCTMVDGILMPDRSMVIENTYSDRVFNGAFSPMACIRANEGFIGMQADEMKLTFASSTGNSDIVIDGESMKSDITLREAIATCSTLEFSTDELSDTVDMDGIVTVSDGELEYHGFIKELELKYAKAEAAKYKLIVKEIKPCL